MKYRKKPVIINAFKWTGDQNQTEDPEWIVEALKKQWPQSGAARINNLFLQIMTLEGIHTANPGDYIIQGVKGELYPCKPDIFELTYEKVEDQS